MTESLRTNETVEPGGGSPVSGRTQGSASASGASGEPTKSESGKSTPPFGSAARVAASERMAALNAAIAEHHRHIEAITARGCTHRPELAYENAVNQVRVLSNALLAIASDEPNNKIST